MKTNEEYRLLEQQNIALAAAIEQMQGQLLFCSEYLEDCANSPYNAAQCRKVAQLQPSPDLLAKRDQMRDAALLREVSRLTIITNDVFNKVRSLAAAREAGEWNPILEIK